MKILINERLSEHRCKTPEGYLICTDAILARTGKQTYRKNEIFKDSDDETEIEVDRTEDEVFSPQTLASFENKPVTVEHPDEDVNVHNYKEYAVGFVRDVRRGEADGQPVILGNLVITDEQTIQEIENGEHLDLSCGYDCDIADEANPCQRNIRGNHVALCECGRAGIARIVDSTCKDFDDTGKNIQVVKAFIEQNGNKFDKHKDADAILEYIKKRTGIANADYGDVLYIIKEYTRAEITDSVKDARMKVANLVNGYAIVPANRWRKFGLNAEVERFTTNLDEARYIRSSLERNDGISFVIVDVTQRRTTDSINDRQSSKLDDKDSFKPGDKIRHIEGDVEVIDKIVHESTFSGKIVKKYVMKSGRKYLAEDIETDHWHKMTDSIKDKLIPPTKESINKFEALLRIFDISIDRKGLTPLGRVHYQVRANMEFDQFVKRLNRIDNEMDELGIPMTFNAGSDGKTCTAGIDLDKQYVKDSQRAQKIIKAVKSIK